MGIIMRPLIVFLNSISYFFCASIIKTTIILTKFLWNKDGGVLTFALLVSCCVLSGERNATVEGGVAAGDDLLSVPVTASSCLVVGVPFAAGV